MYKNNRNNELPAITPQVTTHTDKLGANAVRKNPSVQKEALASMAVRKLNLSTSILDKGAEKIH